MAVSQRRSGEATGEPLWVGQADTDTSARRGVNVHMRLRDTWVHLLNNDPTGVVCQQENGI